jgi:GntP family gluconate:H+ symporter
MAVLYLVLSVVLIILLTTKLKVHPFLALFGVALLYGFLAGMSFESIVESINSGFGDTLGKIGLIIIFGVIIGAFLENSGGAYKIAQAILKVVGKKRVQQPWELLDILFLFLFLQIVALSFYHH